MLLGLSGSGVIAGDSTPAWDLPDSDWADGPVQFFQVAGPAYRKLETEPERARFVEQFWSDHDPTPGTPANEFREFVYRVTDNANNRFTEGTTPGWKTVRGKTLLMAGYPTDWRGLLGPEEIWTYKVKVRDPRIHNPSVNVDWLFSVGFQHKGDSVKAVKYGDHAGLKDLLEYLQHLKPEEYQAYLMSRAVPPPESKGKVTHMAGLMNTLDPGMDDYSRLNGAYKENPPKQDFPITLGSAFFNYSADETLLILTIALNVADAQKDASGNSLFDPYLEVVRTDNVKPGVKPYRLGSRGQDRFTVFRDEQFGRMIFGWSYHVPPGEYEFRAAALDGPGGKITSRTERFTVPSFRTHQPALSSLILARLVTDVSTNPKDWDQLKIGKKHVVPWLDPVRSVPDGLQIVFETYAMKSPEAAITVQQKIGSEWKEISAEPQSVMDSKEGLISATLDQETLMKWEPGTYRITVMVKDSSQEVTISATREFQFMP